MTKTKEEKQVLMPARVLIEAADCLKCIAHPKRLRIIELLLNQEYTVGQISKMCRMTQPTTSEHLRLMSNKGFLKKERRQRNMFYKVSEDQLKNILDCIRKKYLKEK